MYDWNTNIHPIYSLYIIIGQCLVHTLVYPFIKSPYVHDVDTSEGGVDMSHLLLIRTLGISSKSETAATIEFWLDHIIRHYHYMTGTDQCRSFLL